MPVNNNFTYYLPPYTSKVYFFSLFFIKIALNYGVETLFSCCIIILWYEICKQNRRTRAALGIYKQSISILCGSIWKTAHRKVNVDKKKCFPLPTSITWQIKQSGRTKLNCWRKKSACGLKVLTELYTDWEALFDGLNHRATNRFTLCLDEFPYLAKSSPELPSLLQKK